MLLLRRNMLVLGMHDAIEPYSYCQRYDTKYEAMHYVNKYVVPSHSELNYRNRNTPSSVSVNQTVNSQRIILLC
jgi:hypothetical protein